MCWYLLWHMSYTWYLYCWEFKFSLFIICTLFVVFMKVILDKSGSGCCLLGSCNFCLFFSGCFWIRRKERGIYWLVSIPFFLWWGKLKPPLLFCIKNNLIKKKNILKMTMACLQASPNPQWLRSPRKNSYLFHLLSLQPLNSSKSMIWDYEPMLEETKHVGPCELFQSLSLSITNLPQAKESWWLGTDYQAI